MSEPAFDELLRRLVEADIENLKKVAAVAVAANGHAQRGEALLGSPASIAAALAGGSQVAIEPIRS